MPEHYTRNTVEASIYCKKCGKYTMHRIDGVRRGPCLDCIAKLEKQHTEKPTIEPIKQGELF